MPKKAAAAAAAAESDWEFEENEIVLAYHGSFLYEAKVRLFFCPFDSQY
jgi:hypothetical protein